MSSKKIWLVWLLVSVIYAATLVVHTGVVILHPGKPCWNGEKVTGNIVVINGCPWIETSISGRIFLQDDDYVDISDIERFRLVKHLKIDAETSKPPANIRLFIYRQLSERSISSQPVTIEVKRK